MSWRRRLARDENRAVVHEPLYADPYHAIAAQITRTKFPAATLALVMLTLVDEFMLDDEALETVGVTAELLSAFHQAVEAASDLDELDMLLRVDAAVRVYDRQLDELVHEYALRVDDRSRLLLRSILAKHATDAGLVDLRAAFRMVKQTRPELLRPFE